jgi:hypothetical protein
MAGTTTSTLFPLPRTEAFGRQSGSGSNANRDKRPHLTGSVVRRSNSTHRPNICNAVSSVIWPCLLRFCDTGMEEVREIGPDQTKRPLLASLPTALKLNSNAINFTFGGCILLRSLPRLYYGGRQSQLSFLFIFSNTILNIIVQSRSSNNQLIKGNQFK